MSICVRAGVPGSALEPVHRQVPHRRTRFRLTSTCTGGLHQETQAPRGGPQRTCAATAPPPCLAPCPGDTSGAVRPSPRPGAQPLSVQHGTRRNARAVGAPTLSRQVTPETPRWPGSAGRRRSRGATSPRDAPLVGAVSPKARPCAGGAVGERCCRNGCGRVHHRSGGLTAAARRPTCGLTQDSAHARTVDAVMGTSVSASLRGRR
jgi:hypothetical protein